MESEHSSSSPDMTCPQCQKTVAQLVPLDSGLKLMLSKTGQEAQADAVCSACLNKIKGSASKGAQFMAKEEQKTERKQELWRNRLNLVRQGRSCMGRGDYAEAAVAYEKYIKVLMVVLNVSKAELEPKQFSKTPREVTVICSVLWDLMLIYDSLVQFHIKQRECAEILAKFLRFSPLYNTIVRGAEIEYKRAKNPPAFQYLLKLCDAQSSRCFIANSVFQSRTHPAVRNLCLFRDQVLKRSPLGRRFVLFYYKKSPPIALYIDQNPLLRGLLHPVLRGVAFVAKVTFHLPAQPDS